MIGTNVGMDAQQGNNMPTTKTPFDEVAFIMAYEDGELDDDAIIVGFQHLIDSGTVWHLQGSYGRMAARLIETGRCNGHN
jgi:hypothetical protein